jgi:hypothetical protein
MQLQHAFSSLNVSANYTLQNGSLIIGDTLGNNITIGRDMGWGALGNIIIQVQH